jgi:hypothetical protein
MLRDYSGNPMHFLFLELEGEDLLRLDPQKKGPVVGPASGCGIVGFPPVLF